MDKHKFILSISILLGCIILGGFIYASQISKQESIKKQQQIKLQEEKNDKLLTQIIEIEHNLEGIVDRSKACAGILFDYKVEENRPRCLSANDISEWARSTPFQPELVDVKKELLLLSDSLDEYVFQIALYKNQDADWRGEMDKKILIQETSVREAILSVEKKYNINRGIK